MFKLIYFCSILVFTKQCLSGRSPNILIILADDLGSFAYDFEFSIKLSRSNLKNKIFFRLGRYQYAWIVTDSYSKH